jgi:hypothetical protein
MFSNNVSADDESLPESLWGRNAACFLAARFDTLWTRVRRRLRVVIHGEAGLSYTLGMMLTIPLFALLVAAAVEIALMMATKMALQQATIAAGRAAKVWEAADNKQVDAAERSRKVKLAAVNVLWPLASGAKAHAGAWTTASTASSSGNLVENGSPVAVAGHSPETDASAAIEHGYERFAASPRARDYTVRKFLQAYHGTSVVVKREGAKDKPRLKVTVIYNRPFQITPIGRIFGERSTAGFFAQPIEHTVYVVPADPLRPDGKVASDGDLGIDYYRQRVSHDGTAGHSAR